jgi:hypothetical protein
MLLKKSILFVLLLSILMSGFLSTSYANQRWNLLEDIESNPSEFKELEIGEKIVYWYQRKIGEAIVEKDQIVYQFDKKNRELVDVKVHWRDDVPAVLPKLKITKEEAELMVEGTVDFTQLFIISPESDVFPIMPTPENPCWVVESVENDIVIVKVIDAVEGTMVGYGVPPPYTAFSLTGPEYFSPCNRAWTSWAENARDWFNTMGYNTDYVVWPTEGTVKSHIQSNTTAMFYEVAHGNSTFFKSGCSGGQSEESTTASEIETWIAGYCKMPFAFIGSCGGMCSTGDNTLSYEFRKGSTEETTTVGYCEMDGWDCSTYCWYAGYTIYWQTALFTYMNDGDTVKEAFDQANADYPGCSNFDCMRFDGDEDFAVVPVVKRVHPVHNITQNKWYTTIQTAINDANDGDEIVANTGTYYETVDFNGVACTIRSTDPNDVDVVAATIIDANGAGRAVTFNDGEDAHSILMGFTITGGYISGTGDGAGIYCYGSSPTINRCVIYDNNAGDDGGGISCDNSSSPSISYCLITSNEAGDGAGICCNNSSSPTISYCDITENDADDKGGGIYCKASSIPTIEDCEIGSNSAYKGGGIYCSTDLQIERCIVSGNQTSGNSYADGGGIYCSSSSPNILNSIINDNVSDDDAGGIYCYNDSDPNIINCTLTQNEADDKGGGIYCKTNSDAVITNCILWDDTAPNGSEIYVSSSSSVVVSYSDVEGGWSGSYNINSDPCFVNSDANDFHLDFDSPCIDAGDPNGDYDGQKDIDGQPRVIDSRVDIGADEWALVYNINQKKWYTTIQGAIDDANDDDEIVAYPGTYYETVDFNGVACTVRSTDPNDWDVINATIINANCDVNNPGRVVTFENGEDANSILTGFTITGGYANGSSSPDYCGGGIYCYNASPTINRCIITDNKAGVYGGGMYNRYSSPTLTNCVFANNSAVGNGQFGGYGGGISNLTNSVATLNNCTFCGNSAYIDNSNGGYGGGMLNFSSSAVITNCIFWDDYAENDGNEVYNYMVSDDPNFGYCDIEGCGGSGGGWDPNYGNDDGGNIDSDPLFVDPNNDDFHLDSKSPCIDVGDPIGDYTGQTDIDGEARVMGGRIDMGADEIPIIAYWTMDDNAANTTVLDNIGNRNNGTFNDATGNANTSAHHESGQVGGALSFDGVDDYILVSDSDSISVGNSDYTICAWIYPDTVSGLHGIVTKVKNGSGKEYAFSILLSAIRLDVEKDGNNGYASTASGVVAVNSWQHVAVSFDSSSKIPTFYYNGQKQTTTNNTIYDLPDELDDDLYIGMWGGTYNDYKFDGKIDDVILFDRIMSAEEISVLANR